MPAFTYLRNISGVLTEFFGATLGGVPDADKLPALDAAGRLALAMMPTGIGPDVNIVAASEALAANDAVNVWSGGVRKADATVAGKRANGFVLAAVASLAPATVYSEGTVTGMTGLILGADVWLTAVAGVVTTTKPVAAGNIEQRVGVAMPRDCLSWLTHCFSMRYSPSGRWKTNWATNCPVRLVKISFNAPQNGRRCTVLLFIKQHLAAFYHGGGLSSADSTKPVKTAIYGRNAKL